MSRLQHLWVAALFLLTAAAAQGDVLDIRPDHPERYTVVKGDTLWDIASRFLKSPWHWPRIWRINEQVENPHLIYPGDVILLRWVDGQPQLTVMRPEKLAPVTEAQAPVETVAEDVSVDEGPRAAVGGREKLSPKVRAEDRSKAIPTIPPEAIRPWLIRPLVLEGRDFKNAGYITIGRDARRALGTGDEMYARYIKDTAKEFYYVFRKGRPITRRGSKKAIAWEVVYLGDARMMEPGTKKRDHVSKLMITSAVQEILPEDLILPVDRVPPLPVYQPHAPASKVEGAIVLAHNAVAQFGPMQVVVVDLGTNDGMEEGHVLRIWRHVGKLRDPVTRQRYKVPDEPTGLLMVFRPFEKISYGLVMQADRPIHVYDSVTTP